MGFPSAPTIKAVHHYPIDTIRLFRFRDALKDLSSEELFTADEQIYGFKYNSWISQNIKRFPIESLQGEKLNLGNIKTNRHGNDFIFSVSRKSTFMMISALMKKILEDYPKGFICYIKRANKFELTDIDNTIELRDYIDMTLRSSVTLNFKLSSP